MEEEKSLERAQKQAEVAMEKLKKLQADMEKKMARRKVVIQAIGKRVQSFRRSVRELHLQRLRRWRRQSKKLERWKWSCWEWQEDH